MKIPFANIFDAAALEQREAIETEAYQYGARAVPSVCKDAKDAKELGDWFMWFAEACRS